MSKPLFIVCGVLTAAGGGLYGWARSTNDVNLGRDRIKTFEGQISTLNNLKGQDLSEEWIKANNNQIGAYTGEQTKLKTWFGDRRNNMRLWFNNNPTPKPLDFKVNYLNGIKKLSADYIKLAHASAETDASGISKALPHYLNNWGAGAPPDNELAPAQEEFNILEALLGSLNIKNDKNKPIIYNISKIEVSKTVATNNGRPRRGPNRVRPGAPAPASSPFYNKRTVDLTCEIPTSGVNALLNSILTNETLLFSIDSFIAAKTAGVKIDGRKPLKNGLELTLKLAILDFKEDVVKTK